MYHNNHVVKEDSMSVMYRLTENMMMLQYLLHIRPQMCAANLMMRVEYDDYLGT